MAGTAARPGDGARERAAQVAAGAPNRHRAAEKGEHCLRKDLQRWPAASEH